MLRRRRRSRRFVVEAMPDMKITIELPDATFRQAKALFADRGTTLQQFFIDALHEELQRRARENAGEQEAPWMAAFGGLSDLSSEHRRVNAIIEEEFGKLESEDIA